VKKSAIGAAIFKTEMKEGALKARLHLATAIAVLQPV
jgi:hypothetical protein